jgi:hypothetical protein
MYVVDEESHKCHIMAGFEGTRCQQINFKGLSASDHLYGSLHLDSQLAMGYEECSACFRANSGEIQPIASAN